MGATFVNLQIYVGNRSDRAALQAQAVEVMREWVQAASFIELSPPAEAGPSQEQPEPDRTILIERAREDSRWLGVYDQLVENQFESALIELGKLLSAWLEVPVVGVLVYHSDELELRLFEAGELRDTYSSDPQARSEHKLSRQERRALAGQAELWQPFLTDEATPAQLEKVWKKRPIFVEDILHETAQLVGMNTTALTGPHYLLREMPDLTDHFERLDFRLSEPPAYTKAAEGLPRFRLASHSIVSDLRVGQSSDFNNCGVMNLGAASKGLQIIIWGSALDQQLVEIPSATLLNLATSPIIPYIERPQLTLTPFETPDGLKALHLTLPEFEIPGGIADPFDFDPQVDFRRVIEARGKTEILFGLPLQAVKTGQGELYVGFRPLANPDEGTDTWVNQIRISPVPTWHPFYTKPNFYLSREAEALQNPLALVALISMAEERQVCAQVAGDAIEQWHALLSHNPKDRYDITLVTDLDTQLRTSRLAASTIPQGKRWQTLRAAFNTCESLGGTLSPEGQEAPDPFPWQPDWEPSGFLFDASTLFFQRGGDTLVPHLALWASLDGLDSPAIKQLNQELTKIVDQVIAEANGLQAFIAKWAWTPTLVYGAQHTLYETVCGITGQCTTGQNWCRRFVRAVAPQMWLGADLLRQLGEGEADKGRARLSEAGSKLALREVAGGLALQFDSGSNLSELEQLLKPLIPTPRDYSEGLGRLYNPQPGAPQT